LKLAKAALPFAASEYGKLPCPREYGFNSTYYLKTACLEQVFQVYYVCMVKKSEHRDLFPGALELMILKSLNWKPMHGYALAQRLKDISEDYLQIEEGSLYPALQRMLKTGWLETEMGLSARNRPVRVFKVTDAGKKHLEQELASVEKMFAGVTRVLALAGQ
jgi:PadR family transcriptional regulator, regulatory protein PadR